RQLMGALGAEKERIKIIDGDADAPQKFAYAVSNFVRSLNSMPALGLGKKKAAELDDLLKGEIPERKMLLRIVQSLSKKLGIKSKDIKGNYAFGDLVVDYNKCTLCGACASLCSTEALTSTPEDLPTITFVHAYCTACGICEKICPEKALKVRRMLDLERFVSVKPHELKTELIRCAKCGKPVMAATAYKKLSALFKKRELELLGMCRDCKNLF
ncbi:MAG: 4Fe-4S binding protein, partial [Euryarchaeota archaeon]|nr:4Fe-4S binding protein [Euryarchaeota archaeon]